MGVSGHTHVLAATYRWQSEDRLRKLVLLPYRFSWLNLGSQAWWQMPLPTEPSHQPDDGVSTRIYCFIIAFCLEDGKITQKFVFFFPRMIGISYFTGKFILCLYSFSLFCF